MFSQLRPFLLFTIPRHRVKNINSLTIVQLVHMFTWLCNEQVVRWYTGFGYLIVDADWCDYWDSDHVGLVWCWPVHVESRVKPFEYSGKKLNKRKHFRLQILIGHSTRRIEVLVLGRLIYNAISSTFSRFRNQRAFLRHAFEWNKRFYSESAKCNQEIFIHQMFCQKDAQTVYCH